MHSKGVSRRLPQSCQRHLRGDFKGIDGAGNIFPLLSVKMRGVVKRWRFRTAFQYGWDLMPAIMILDAGSGGDS